MGQQAASFAPCVARQKESQNPKQLAEYLQRVERLLLDTETLQRECDAHFRRVGLDAHGTMRRVELRRLLWTFAHSLGSSELTWEAIEAKGRGPFSWLKDLGFERWVVQILSRFLCGLCLLPSCAAL
ncbi:unnamed protein product [Effrenium voratum]|nr:unnamed protein product [Effrenium voratum]